MGWLPDPVSRKATRAARQASQPEAPVSGLTPRGVVRVLAFFACLAALTYPLQFIDSTLLRALIVVPGFVILFGVFARLANRDAARQEHHQHSVLETWARERGWRLIESSGDAEDSHAGHGWNAAFVGDWFVQAGDAVGVRWGYSGGEGLAQGRLEVWDTHVMAVGSAPFDRATRVLLVLELPPRGPVLTQGLPTGATWAILHPARGRRSGEPAPDGVLALGQVNDRPRRSQCFGDTGSTDLGALTQRLKAGELLVRFDSMVVLSSYEVGTAADLERRWGLLREVAF